MQKYFELYNTIFLMRKKAEQQRKILDMNVMNTSVVNLTLKYMLKNLFLKIRDKDTMQNILMQTKNFLQYV